MGFKQFFSVHNSNDFVGPFDLVGVRWRVGVKTGVTGRQAHTQIYLKKNSFFLNILLFLFNLEEE